MMLGHAELGRANRRTTAVLSVQLLTVPELRAALKALGLGAPSSANREQVVRILRDALVFEGDAQGQAEQVLRRPTAR